MPMKCCVCHRHSRQSGGQDMTQLVRLKYATTQMFALGGIPGGVAYTYVRAKVKNIAYAKDVIVHYRLAESPQSWVDIALVWLANHGNYDVFGIGDGGGAGGGGGRASGD